MPTWEFGDNTRMQASAPCFRPLYNATSILKYRQNPDFGMVHIGRSPTFVMKQPQIYDLADYHVVNQDFAVRGQTEDRQYHLSWPLLLCS